jgi:L-aminopeptidase/D-esterase-like protein
MPPRARDLGIPFDGTPGPHNAITDLTGVEVGYTTLVAGEGPLQPGRGPVRTGVTTILPRGRESADAVFAGWFSLNGSGEMTGTAWIEEAGFLEGPIALTNTHAVGAVHQAVIAWQAARKRILGRGWALPVVAETYDGYLNDIDGFHVKPEHVREALDGARSGPLAEGNVGGGTGMHLYEFKGGTGTASRVLADRHGGYRTGVLVQANCGRRPQLRVAGIPVGRAIAGDAPFSSRGAPDAERGSIIVVVGTDAPLLPHQLKRVARRAALGLARTGSESGNGSGDLFLAFSTANPGAASPAGTPRLTMLPNDRLDPVFGATVEATEEAIVNALVAAETMVGADGHRLIAIPHDRLRAVLARHGRLMEGRA